MADSWAKVAAMAPKSGGKAAKGGCKAKPATAVMALPPPKAFPKGGAPPAASEPVGAAGPSGPANQVMATAAAAAPSADSAPPVTTPAATAPAAPPVSAPPVSTPAATQPSATAAATGTQPAQQQSLCCFSAPPPPPMSFGSPVLTCMICGQNMKGGFHALLAHQATSSRCRARQGLQGPTSGRSPCPHGCGRTVAHQDPWALAQHERFCTALKQARQPTTGTTQAAPVDMSDHLLPRVPATASVSYRSTPPSMRDWPRQRWADADTEDNNDNNNNWTTPWNRRNRTTDSRSWSSYWQDSDQRWTNDDWQNDSEWYWDWGSSWESRQSDQRWDSDNRSSYWRSNHDDWLARGWRDY